MLAMYAFSFVFANFGIAMAARIPMITTTNLNYGISAGNTVTISAATGTGWSATSKNTATTKTCGIFVGSATPPVTGEAEGAPTCQ